MARKLDVSEARVYGVATFYENFSLVPKGRFIIKVCEGTACHVRNSAPLLEALRKALGLSEAKSTTDDLCFTVETVSCLGACALAPVLSVNDTVHAAMTPDKVMTLLYDLKTKIEEPDFTEEDEEAERAAGYDGLRCRLCGAAGNVVRTTLTVLESNLPIKNALRIRFEIRHNLIRSGV
jgi:NADH-quinone oxidoreductase subunit E